MTTIRIDLTGKSVDTALALAEFVQAHGLKMQREDPHPHEAALSPESAEMLRKGIESSKNEPHVDMGTFSKPKRKAKSPKAPKVTKAAGRVKAKPVAKSSATLTAADVLAAVKANPGQRSEVYTAGQTVENREAVKRGLAKLRKEGLVKSEGSKRATTWTPVTVEHKGQTLVHTTPKKTGRVDTARVRDAATKAHKRTVTMEPASAGAEE